MCQLRIEYPTSLGVQPLLTLLSTDPKVHGHKPQRHPHGDYNYPEDGLYLSLNVSEG